MGLKKRLKKSKKAQRIEKHDDLQKLQRQMRLRKLAERNARDVGRTQNDETVTVSTEEYAKVHMNREHYAVMDKNWRYGL